MSSMPVTGLCIFSIDVCGPGGAAPNAERERLIADVCGQLAAVEVPVTLGLAESPGDELRQAIDRHAGCEAAVLAQPSWAAEGSSRSLFCDALAQRLTTLRSAGLVPTTLTLPSARLAAHDDLLVQHGVTAVRVAAGRNQEPRARGWWRREKSAKPLSPLRWGLWEVVVNVELGAVGLAGTRRIVDRLTRQGGTAVIAADAATLERQAKHLSRFLDHLTRRRDEKLLSIETVAASITRQQVRRQTPARSILRPAA